MMMTTNYTYYFNLLDVSLDDLRSLNLKRQLRDLHEFLEKRFPSKYKHQFTTQHAVQFEFTEKGITLEVDLLLSAYWDNPQELYTFLRTVSPEKRKQ